MQQAVHAKQFMAEFHAFWDHVAVGVREFDLPWVGLMCIVSITRIRWVHEQCYLEGNNTTFKLWISLLTVLFAHSSIDNRIRITTESGKHRRCPA